MRLNDLLNVDGWECLNDPGADDRLTAGYTSDLLSDVMANAPAGSALITLQAHLNTVAVASLAEVRAIVICHARPVPDDMIAAARRENIMLLRTADNQFETSVKLHQLLEKP